MTPVTKIFVVLVCLFAFIFTPLAISFVARSDNWKQLAQSWADQAETEEMTYEDMRGKLIDALKKVFRPEFLNRLDGVVVFRSLTKDEIRQIVAGMQQFYQPDDLVGRDVVVVTNLAPATIFGVESNGMILAAGEAASLLTPLKPVEPGTKIR